MVYNVCILWRRERHADDSNRQCCSTRFFSNMASLSPTSAALCMLPILMRIANNFGAAELGTNVLLATNFLII